MDRLEAELSLKDSEPLIRDIVVNFEALLNLLLLIIISGDEAGDDLCGRRVELHVVDLLGLGIDPTPTHALDNNLISSVEDKKVCGHGTAGALADLVTEVQGLGLGAGEAVEDPATFLAGLELGDNGGDDQVVGNKVPGSHDLGDLLADFGARACLGAEDVAGADDGEVVVLAHGLALGALPGGRGAGDDNTEGLGHGWRRGCLFVYLFACLLGFNMKK